MADEQAAVTRPAAPSVPEPPPEAPIDLSVEIVSPRTSESIAQLASALALAQGEITVAVKDATNPFHKNRYATLASTWEACRAALSKNGLSVIQPVRAKGKVVLITTRLMHASGEWIEETLLMTAGQDTPQGIGGTITYGRRYALSAMVGVAPDDDDDGNQASNLLPQGVKVDRGGRSAVSQAQPVGRAEVKELRHCLRHAVYDNSCQDCYDLQLQSGKIKGAPEAEQSAAVASQAQNPTPPLSSAPVRPSARPTAPLSGGVTSPPAHSAPPPPPGLKPPQRAPGT